MSGLSGVVSTLPMLLLIRVVMGATEGAFLSTSVALTAEASHPKRLGLNQGLQLSSFSLIGLMLGPILATQLLSVVPSWRWVFVIVALPGFVLNNMVPTHLVNHVHLSTASMGYVTSGLGVGGFIGGIVLPGASDHLGRRLTAVLGFLFACLFGASFFGSGVLGSILAGYVAQHYGIDKVPLFTLVGLFLGVVVSLFIRETAPRRVRSAALMRA